LEQNPSNEESILSKIRRKFLHQIVFMKEMLKAFLTNNVFVDNQKIHFCFEKQLKNDFAMNLK
jgi:hypothetical protein